MEVHKRKPITVNAEEGQLISMVGDNYRIVISGKQTGGSFAVIDMVIPPGSGPGPHAHANLEESFYVIDGEVEVKSEFGNYTAKKGGFVNIPKGGVVHSFKNKTAMTAHLLCMVVPAGLEAFFEEVGQPIAPGEKLPPPPMNEDSLKELRSIVEKYGMQLFPPDYLK